MKPYKKRSRTPDEDKLVWLLDFIQRDLATLREGERLDLDDDMSRLLWLRDPAANDPPDAPDPYQHGLAKLRGEAVSDLPWPDRLALEVQTALKQGITRLEAGKGWQPFAPRSGDGKRPDVLFPIFVVAADKTVTRRYHGSYEAKMLASAVDLLVAFWPRIRRCDLTSCRRLFLVEDGRQRFHAPPCANIARLETPPEKRKPRDYAQEAVNANRRDQLKKKKQQAGKKKKEKR